MRGLLYVLDFARIGKERRVLAGRAPARGWDLSRSTRVVGFEREERARRVG